MKYVSCLKRSLCITFLLLTCTGALNAQPKIQLTPLGQVVIPYNKSFKDTPIGGLSGLTYDKNTHTYYTISDDRSQHADARFYAFKLSLNKGKLEKGSIKFKNVSFLKTPAGKPYPKDRIDPEGIAIGSDNFIYVSSEGVPAKRIAPFVNGYNMDGTFGRALTIPEAYWGKHHMYHGVRINLGFEGLTVSPNASTLYAAIENALKQDGPKASEKDRSPARIIMYDLPSGNIEAEYQYMVEPIRIKEGFRGKFAVNGLSDILALDNKGTLLALERNYVFGQGNSIRLYEISTRRATNIKGSKKMAFYPGDIKPVTKTLIADLSTYDISIDNFEGLALGPKLPDGGQLLLMVSDNNFSILQQTIFTAFELKR